MHSMGNAGTNDSLMFQSIQINLKKLKRWTVGQYRINRDWPSAIDDGDLYTQPTNTEELIVQIKNDNQKDNQQYFSSPI